MINNLCIYLLLQTIIFQNTDHSGTLVPVSRIQSKPKA